MPTRQNVYDAIDTERTYQDGKWPGWRDDVAGIPLQSVGAEILLAEEYLARARAAWTHERAPEISTLHILRKAAGILVRCLERHGCPQRRTNDRGEPI